MIKIEKKLVESEIITDVTCDSCGKSCYSEYGFSYMTLSAHWGYTSNKDLEAWSGQLCEACVDKHLGFITFKKENYYP